MTYLHLQSTHLQCLAGTGLPSLQPVLPVCLGQNGQDSIFKFFTSWVEILLDLRDLIEVTRHNYDGKFEREDEDEKPCSRQDLNP